MTLAALLFSVESFAQLDRSKAPEPGPAPKVEMGSYEKFTLKNGLKVIVVENSKRPVVTASLNFYRDPVLEGDKAGLLSIYGDLWSKGTKKHFAGISTRCCLCRRLQSISTTQWTTRKHGTYTVVARPIWQGTQ